MSYGKPVDHFLGKRPPLSRMETNLRIRIGSTSLLAGDSVDGIHVVVSHVGPLRGLVFRAHRNGQVLCAA